MRASHRPYRLDGRGESRVISCPTDREPRMEAEFEAGAAKAAPFFKRAKGCKAMSLHRSVEKPSRYRLFVTWETVEDHTKDFYGSADWQEWRKCVAQTFE